MLCKPGLCCHAVCVSVCVCHVRTFCQNEKISNFSPSDSHTIPVFFRKTAWQHSDGNLPNDGVECRWGRQKSRFWINIWLHWVLWSVPAANAIHLAATNHAEFITLVTGKRPSLLVVGNNDEVYDKKPRRYAADIVIHTRSGKSEA